MRSIIPIARLDHRMVEQGRIRLGEQVATKRGGTRPSTLEQFRFTSTDRAALLVLSELYGGEVKPWSNPKANPPDQWELYSTSSRIKIWLPPGGVDMSYERWANGYCLRRCDGEMSLTRVESGPGDYETIETACQCTADNVMSCKPYTRLNVVLPGVPFGGTWRCESHGWNAQAELPGMIQTIFYFQEQGIVEAYLEIGKRTAEGGSKEFIVPILGLEQSAQALMEGKADVREIGRAPGAPALAPPKPADVPWGDPDRQVADPDDEVIEAELVDDHPPEVIGLAHDAIRENDHADPDSPFFKADELVAGLLADGNLEADVVRKLQGVIDGKAKIVDDGGRLRVVAR